jgi:adenylate cyclase
LEIERKFLVKNDSWRGAAVSQERLIQGYIAANANATVRVRVKGDSALITVKGAGSSLSRREFEYPIPVEDGVEMLRQLAASAPIEKLRYRVPAGRHLWDLDLFAGANAGLILAEVELASEDEVFELPGWAGEEVTGDPRYYNVNLARHPYTQWRG